MPPAKIRYDFSATLWQHQSPGGWWFVSLPNAISNEIRKHLQWQEEGWGRMKASASVASCEWETAIWYDKKKGTYLLPIKANIRKVAKLEMDEKLAITLWI